MTCFPKCHKFPAIKGTFEFSFTNLDHDTWKMCPLPPNSTYLNMGIQQKGSAKLLRLTWLWQMDVNCLLWQITTVWRHCSEAWPCCQAVDFPFQGLCLLSPGPRARWPAALGPSMLCSLPCVLMRLHWLLCLLLARMLWQQGALQTSLSMMLSQGVNLVNLSAARVCC